MRYVFYPCPDCGCCEDPHIFREAVRDFKGNMVDSTVRAVCKNCEWETQGHKNVEKCANDWNMSGAYLTEHIDSEDCELPF